LSNLEDYGTSLGMEYDHRVRERTKSLMSNHEDQPRIILFVDMYFQTLGRYQLIRGSNFAQTFKVFEIPSNQTRE
jgi:hypothetical protein